jgi:protein gp37
MSRIEWTGITWNPVTGCDRISPGCDHCYALTLAKRLKAMGQARYQHDGNPVTSGPGFAVTCHPAALAIPYRWATPRVVFVNSMSDLFHARVPEPFIRDVFAVMAGTPAHVYQVLTKRPRRALRLASSLPWPRNLWLGVSIEHARYQWRADTLRAIPAAIRFISAEPLLGPLDSMNLAGIGWVIAGGESGPGYRPPDRAWFRDLRDRCAAAGVPFFFKQWGGPTPKAGGRLLDGRTHDAMPVTITISQGGTR